MVIFRKRKVMEMLVDMIESFPVNEPESENLQESLHKIRAKFKQVGRHILRTPWAIPNSLLSYLYKCRGLSRVEVLLLIFKNYF